MSVKQLTTYEDMLKYSQPFINKTMVYLNEEELLYCRTIDDVFKDEAFAYIIRNSHAQDIVHITIALRVDENTVEYFDSFGKDCKTLNKLCKATGVQYSYSKHKLQSPKTFICGYWVYLRLLGMKAPLDDWVKIFRSNRSLKPDEIAHGLITFV